MAKYHYRCPKCFRKYELRKRVTLGKRHCPHCGVEITTEAIDKQKMFKWIIWILFGFIMIISWLIGLQKR